MTLDRLLTWFVNGWISLIVLANLIGIVGAFFFEPTVWAAISRIQETYSPWNIWNWLAEVISLSPALAVMAWRDNRRKRLLISN